MRIAVLDYGSGNIRSAYRALSAAVDSRGECIVTSDAREVGASDGLVVPGVGAFAACMAGLDQINGQNIIRDAIAAGKEVLGICVGMQIMFTEGIEHEIHSNGVGVLPGKVEKLGAQVLPHMGWNTVDAHPQSQLFSAIAPTERFYFVHSYATLCPYEEGLVSVCSYGSEFVAALERDNVSVTQFHPEKSALSGLRLLTNWVDRCRS